MIVGCTGPGGSDPGILRQQYPHVVYRGASVPPAVKIQKTRPAHWVGLDEISRNAVGAIVVSEDWAFFQHKGYDPNQIREAIKEDLEEGRFARGASTITQQVVKNVFLDSEKSLSRKFREFFMAIAIERKLSKTRILEIYMNIAEWGEGIYGIGPASRHYFGKTPSELTPSEGAFLAMLLPSPKRYSQSFRDKKLTNFARRSVHSILRKMAQAHYLEDSEVELEIQKKLSFESVDSEVTET